jgi:peptidoglycan hydrolase CwlO-like protein
MAELDIQLKRIQDKLQQLLKQQTVLQKENDLLKQEISSFKNETAVHKSNMDELKQQVSILKMNTAEMNEPDKKEFEKRLNHYIREIDRCIALLSE